MFFWMVLASLMGIIVFGNLTEKTKNQEDFVVPVYEAMALSTLQQHVAAERGYATAIQAAPGATNTYQNTPADGIVPIITVENGALTKGGTDNNNIFDFVQSYLPATYKPQDNTRTYLFCIPTSQTGETSCGATDVVKYLVTVRTVPYRYEGSNKMTSLKAMARATSGSKFFGMLHHDSDSFFLEDNPPGTHQHQPLGAQYYILTAGDARAEKVYIPNYITCNFPLKNNASEGSDDFLGDHLKDKRSYIVALSLISGLDNTNGLDAHKNLPLGERYCFDEGGGG